MDILEKMKVVCGNEIDDGYSFDFRERNHAYYLGFLFATEQMAKLIEKGYQRPQEIYNIMRDFMNGDLLKWSNKNTDVPMNDIVIDTWKDVKKIVHDREDGLCFFCGDKGVDVHHIQQVQHSGLPDVDNLILLCDDCHKGQHR